MAIGAGKMEKGHRIPLDVKVGDRILFGKYTGNDIKIDDQEYLILREEEILVKLSGMAKSRSEEHTSELQSRLHLVCRLLLEKQHKDRQHRTLLDVIRLGE